jgi:hypothetical protein
MIVEKRVCRYGQSSEEEDERQEGRYEAYTPFFHILSLKVKIQKCRHPAEGKKAQGKQCRKAYRMYLKLQPLLCHMLRIGKGKGNEKACRKE